MSLCAFERDLPKSRMVCCCATEEPSRSHAVVVLTPAYTTRPYVRHPHARALITARSSQPANTGTRVHPSQLRWAVLRAFPTPGRPDAMTPRVAITRGDSSPAGTPRHPRENQVIL